MTALIITAVIAFIAGFASAAILSMGSNADDYDPNENDPVPPRVMPRIWDKYNGKETR